MTLVISANSSIKQTSASTPNLSVLPKPLSLIIDARALDFKDGDLANEFIAGGVWSAEMRTFNTVLGLDKTAPIYKKSDGYSGCPCLSFDSNQNIRSKSTESVKLETLAIATLCRVRSRNNDARIAGVGSTAANRRGVQLFDKNRGVGAVFNGTNIFSNTVSDDFDVVIAYFDGAESKLLVGDSIYKGATSGDTAFSDVTLGSDNSGTTALRGDISYCAIYEHKLSDAQLFAWKKEILDMFF